jgi:hypothetical protein
VRRRPGRLHRAGSANPTGTSSSSAPTDDSSTSQSTTQTDAGGKPATIVNQGGKIIITGSGDSTIGPLDFDQPYYVVRSSGTASMISAVEADGIGILVAGSFGTKVFRVSPDRAKGDRFEVTADGGYRIELSPPSTLPAPVAPPATLSGAVATNEIYGPFAFDKATSMVLTYKGTSKGMLPSTRSSTRPRAARWRPRRGSPATGTW